VGGGGEISCPPFLYMGGDLTSGLECDTGLCGGGGLARNKQDMG